MRSEISELAGGIVTSAKGKDEFDFLEDFAGEVPARIIAGILGIPEASYREDLVFFIAYVLGRHKSLVASERKGNMKIVAKSVLEHLEMCGYVITKPTRKGRNL
ncbi:MAG: hypothetical protein AAFR75_09320 [Pseudomonadota bacterium]